MLRLVVLFLLQEKQCGKQSSAQRKQDYRLMYFAPHWRHEASLAGESKSFGDLQLLTEIGRDFSKSLYWM